jgi:hypothetical protein
MTNIHRKSTFARLADDFKTAVDWLIDWDERSRRAHLCNMSSVGLSDERREALLHEGRCLLRTVNGVLKRMGGK